MDFSLNRVTGSVNPGNLPEGWMIPSKKELSWTRDDQRLFFGLKPEIEKKEEGNKEQKEEEIDIYDIETLLKKREVDVWHWNDPFIVPNQKKIVSRLGSSAYLSPQGKFVVYYRDKHWYLYECQTEKSRNLIENLNSPFYNEDHDYPSPVPGYGIGGWTENDETVLIYDKYDIWEYPERYIENSPVFFADRINTPLLIMFGDEDGAVPWYQGIELYLAMRRLEKDCIFLQYRGEPHHPQKYPNKLDYTIKMKEYLDHYCKGAPAPKWIKEGVPYQGK